MPGFLAPSSVNHAGQLAPSAKAETKRKHRWVFSVFWDGDISELSRTSVYLQSAQRPHAIIEEAIMHHDEEQSYYAGKYHWEPISLVFYDVQNPVDSSDAIWTWFNNIVNVPNVTVSAPADYKKTCLLEMTDGSGEPVETWALYNTWPIDVNWNELDYTSTEIQTIDVSLKYDRAEKI